MIESTQHAKLVQSNHADKTLITILNMWSPNSNIYDNQNITPTNLVHNNSLKSMINVTVLTSTVIYSAICQNMNKETIGISSNL